MPASGARRDRVAKAIARMIEQLSRTLASQAFEAGLNPAQWAALRHVATANESARHIGAFAQLHRTTHGSASQTIGALVAKGLLAKKPGLDGRQRVLSMTPKGEALLRRDPLNDLARTIATLSDGQLFSMAEILELLIRDAMAKEGNK